MTADRVPFNRGKMEILPEFTENQKLQRRISRAGGKFIGERDFLVIGSIRTIFLREDIEELLNGRSEKVNFSGKKGRLLWGFDFKRAWIGAEVNREKINLVLNEKGEVFGRYFKSGRLIEDWVSGFEEVTSWVDHRDKILNIK